MKTAQWSVRKAAEAALGVQQLLDSDVVMRPPSALHKRKTTSPHGLLVCAHCPSATAVESVRVVLSLHFNSYGIRYLFLKVTHQQYMF